MDARFKKATAAVALVVSGTLLLAGCSGTAEGPEANADEAVELNYFTWSDETAVSQANALISAFNEEYPNITVNLDANPGGSEGDNLIKTRLATGEMSDVFQYNSGSLLQALNPAETLVDLSGEAWASDVDDDFRAAVSSGSGVYGAPVATAQAGGIVYNKAIYADLGLEVPTDWEQFMDNNKVIAEAGIAPVYQAYGDAWTSQLILLGGFANVSAEDPDWAAKYTENQRTFSEPPAFAGFRQLEELATAEMFNENYPSATNDDAVAALVAGTAAHYPILTDVALTNARQNWPDSMGE